MRSSSITHTFRRTPRRFSPAFFLLAVALGFGVVARAVEPAPFSPQAVYAGSAGSTARATTALAPPTIVSGTVAFQQGTPTTTVRIATVSDPDQPANTLSIIATPTTGSGVTVNNLSIAPSGEVSASITASCDATISTFDLTVADRDNTTATALLTVNVTSNTTPNQGAYPTTTLPYSMSRTVAPNAPPRDNGAIMGITATASAGFTGSLSVNQTTGLVMISDARPAGVYTVTVEATDNCNAKATSVFRLTVSQLSTTTALVVAPGLYIEGYPVNLAAQVTATQPNAGVPTGSVTFYDGTTALGTVDLDAAGRAALATLNIGSGSRGITAVYNGDRNFLISTSTPAALNVARALANVSAASYRGETLASEQIVAAFGTHLATGTLAATTLPLPTVLAGTAVRVRDSLGDERLAPLFFVSPTQVNYLVPPGTAQGTALVTILASDGSSSAQPIQIVAVNPGLFSADSTGKGAPAAVILRVRADGTQIFEPAARREQGSNEWSPVPIDLGPATEQVFLVLFGTGVRFRTSLAAVMAKIGGEDAPVSFAGPQGRNEGLDQINLRLPRSLAGRGNADVNLLVDGKATNTVRVNIR